MRRRVIPRLAGLFVGQGGRDVVSPAPPVPIREIVREFWPFARAHRWYIAAALAITALVPVADGARLYMVKVITDEALIPQELSPFAWIAPVLIGLTLLAGALSFLETYVATWVGQRFLLAMRGHILDHLQGLSLTFFEGRRLGDLLARLTGDIAKIEAFVVTGVVTALGSVARLVFYGAALFYLDWRLALVALSVGPIFAVIIRHFSRLLKLSSRETRRRAGALSAYAEESLSNVALVQAYNREQTELDRYERENQAAFEATMVVSRLKAAFPPAIEVVQVAAVLTMIAIGTLAMQSGGLSLGSVLLFVAYLGQIFGPVRTLARLYGVIYGASAGAERVIELLREEPAVVDSPGAVGLGRADGEVV
ncbi:MAG: ABC transporter ATP-binding protein, partial [Thermoleophilaceae bacterium]